jgi:LPXTG-site transpeptidase (sortase) family protein
MDIVMKKTPGLSVWIYPIIGILAVIIGLAVYIGSGSYRNFSAPHAVTTLEIQTPVAVETNTKQPPTSVFIPSIHKRLPIQAALVKGNSWDMFDTSVAWLSTSATPGDGNVILYAHDWPSLWGNLYTIKPGDTVEVEQNTLVHTYIVTESRAVNPQDVEAILSSDNQLTMFTCEGTFDQKRRVVYAKPL